MKRTVIPELLDTDSGTPSEIAASLADLRRINQSFGGISTTQSLIERAAPGRRSLSLLEVAAGAGDVPKIVRRRLQRRGVLLGITLLDRALSHLNSGIVGARKGGDRTVVGDALALPFRDGSFDLVSCSLFVHHLSPEQIVCFVNESLRVCRTALLINDVVRHRLHLAAVYAGWPLFRSPITRHDSVASIHRAYTPTEMRALLQKSASARFEIQQHYLFRMAVIAWKK